MKEIKKVSFDLSDTLHNITRNMVKDLEPIDTDIVADTIKKFVRKEDAETYLLASPPDEIRLVQMFTAASDSSREGIMSAEDLIIDYLTETQYIDKVTQIEYNVELKHLEIWFEDLYMMLVPFDGGVEFFAK